jgi:hypothetical protein
MSTCTGAYTIWGISVHLLVVNYASSNLTSTVSLLLSGHLHSLVYLQNYSELYMICTKTKNVSVEYSIFLGFRLGTTKFEEGILQTFAVLYSTYFTILNE